jgi:alkylated DNA repair dioxygenase AlkB
MGDQLSLLGRGAPELDPQLPTLKRRDLGAGAWFEYGERCVGGQEGLLEQLKTEIRWQQTSQHLYEREVETPRLVASLEDLSAPPPILRTIADALGRRYGATFDQISFALYRDGNDSVAWHRDRNLRREHSGFVATVSLGEPRPFLLRPRGGGASIKLQLGWGDLLVMGGTCQRTWEHTLPKVRSTKGPRLAIMFRHSERIRAAG